MEVSLKVRTVNGISWTLFEKFGVQGVKFVLGIILARLLEPQDFGLIGLIMVFFIISQVLVESGFAQSYIQKKQVSDDDANTVFYTNLFISILIYVILWLIAPYIAKFYDQFLLVKLIRVMGFVVILNAFSVIQIAMITRKVSFKRKSKVILIATIVSGICGVISAYYGYGVWALVTQNMVQAFLTTFGLWVTTKWKPGLKFSVTSFKEMFSYGIWILLASIIQKLFDNIYILTIGKFFPAVQLGFFVQAKKLQQLSSEQIVGAVGLVSFPVFSKIQEQKDRLQNGMRNFLKHTLMIIMPLQITLMVIAKPFVILLLTEKWAPMVPYLQLLCIIGFLYPIHVMNLQVLKAQGKSKINFGLNLFKNFLRVINIIVMYKLGIKYIIIGDVVVSLLALFVNTYFTNKMVNYGILKQLYDVKEIIIGAIVAGIIGYFISFKFVNLWIVFFIGGLTTILLFLAIQYLINRKFLFEVINLKDILKHKKT